jgi:predicted nucleic acid-binding protein
VVDASVALRRLLERSERADELLRGEFVAAPTTIVLEVLNGLATQVRFGGVSLTLARALFGEFRELELDLIPAEALGMETLTLAAQLELSAYDASYVALAARLDATLATGDRRLAERYERSEFVV